ncbi:restriction endonuclease subunit S [Polaribacter sp. R2A056_3_33]|uniref:restriction endonuclease subunit S n=1 Tax=Polaribacter sp. R2A056_3_33 TaxID=2745563 RepID=UPI001C4FB2DC|nr:restriction endonuclease subunit S [Polaribacter sp. R2A056_3_33]QXP70750.1 restriction endonuclease subunit S [Polaribacter sp. R2A056_3_33]
MIKGWKEEKLKKVAPYWNGKIETKELDENNFISAENMFPDKGGVTKSSYVKDSGKATTFKKNDILVSNIRPYFKKIWFADKNGGCSNDVIVFRTNQNLADSTFLYYYLSKDDFFDFMMAGANGTKMPRGNKKSIPQYKINLPPLKTQRKIASILSAYDDLIENNLKRIKLLEEQAQQTYEEWFVRFKFPGYEDVDVDAVSGLPVGWEKRTLEELVSLQQGFALNKKSNHHISKEKTGFPLLKIGDLFNGTETLFVKETIPKQFLVNENEIIYSRTGQVGHAFMGRRGVIYNNCFRVSANDKIERLLLYYFLISPSIVETAKSLATGSAQPDLNHGAFKSIQINLPPLDIQKKFSIPMEQNLELIYNLQNQNQHLKEARDILLPRLMSGMIDPSRSSGQVVDGLEVDKYLGMVAEECEKYN